MDMKPAAMDDKGISDSSSPADGKSPELPAKGEQR